MKKMIIFEPAMCCSTGVCGPVIDKELFRVSTVINNLKSNGILVERYNLSSAPHMFVHNKEINEIINKDGVGELPVTIVDNVVVKRKEYPTNEEFCTFLEVSQKSIESGVKKNFKGCDCGNGKC
ncbi:arsenite efflux transporter metallochaperone ArsD [Clostridium oceanicum]|uniref:Arsenite efflux transporter metallochaperone ArsD n=1 Tax=Clostridium oceanicum TaxID=1543 RepID=A0ABP3USD3_9CLOT